MEIRKDKGRKIYRGIFACLMVLCTCLIAGCGERYNDSDCAWISETPYIYWPSEGFPVVIDIEGVDQTKGIHSLSDSGRGYIYFQYGEEGGEPWGDIVWEAEATVRGDKLYLKVVKDYVSDYEGETIVLERHPKEEGSE